MFVVKANAYGHGLREIIEITKNESIVDQYAVDSLEEALLIATLQKKKPDSGPWLDRSGRIKGIDRQWF